MVNTKTTVKVVHEDVLPDFKEAFQYNHPIDFDGEPWYIMEIRPTNYGDMYRLFLTSECLELDRFI